MEANSPSIEWAQPEGGSATTVSAPVPFSISGEQRHKNALYLYFDESGNLDFSRSGTPFFIITCAVARRPFRVATRLGEYKYDLYEAGLDIPKLHACEDNSHVRTAVYERLSSTPGAYRVYTAYVEKEAVPEKYRTPDAIYSKIFELLVDEVSDCEVTEGVEIVIAITDLLPKDAAKKQVTKPLKRYMGSRFQDNGMPYILMHHESASDMNLQIADYYCWAAHRCLTKGKDWPMSKVLGSFVEIGRVKFN